MGNDALFSPHSESSQLVELDGLWTAVQLAHRCSEASPRFDPLAPPPAVRSGSTAGLVALGGFQTRDGFYSQATASGALLRRHGDRHHSESGV